MPYDGWRISNGPTDPVRPEYVPFPLTVEVLMNTYEFVLTFSTPITFANALVDPVKLENTTASLTENWHELELGK